MSLQVTHENAVDMAWDYLYAVYGRTILQYRDECPYDLNLDGEALVYRQICVWFMHERNGPTGRTVIDEFVKRFVDDKKLAAKMLRMKDLMHDAFTIMRPPDRDRVLGAVSKSTGRKFRIRVPQTMVEHCGKDRTLTGRIHPWGEDGVYYTVGIMRIEEGMEERLEEHGIITPRITNILLKRIHHRRQDRAESITVTLASRADTLLKKLPSDWINGMCDALKIRGRHTKQEKVSMISAALTSPARLRRIVSGLPGDGTAALRLVLQNGGAMKHSMLCKKVGADDTADTWTRQPESAVGILRRHGLLIVGRQRISVRTYKMAVIPADVRGPLARCMRLVE